MSLAYIFRCIALSAGVALATSTHAAGEHHQHGAHVHGAAAINIALDANDFYLEFRSPAANIFGFEHAPSSEADHTAQREATAVLRQTDRLFRFNPEAGCRIEHIEISSEEHKGSHADIEAVYHFDCEQPGELTQLDVRLFEAFPAIGEIDVQLVVGSSQGARELTPKSHLLTF